MNEQTDLTLPANLPFPVTVSKRLVSPGDEIKRGTPLLHYSYRYKSHDDPDVETRYGTWESYVEGTVNFWNIESGDIVNRGYGPVLVVTEPCKHGVQIAGMCANCGKDMTEVDYMSVSSSERAKIKMDYMADGPLMSLEEAARIEKENTEHLIKKRKLSLIVDLDQTIIHTTCDPTVGEWIKAKQASQEGSTTPPSESANWPALDDVVKFQLGDDRHYGHLRPDSTWYYVKPRPGLSDFMAKISKLYEMHVYTMGTRSYADAVCAAIDPTGTWFGHRILTRSESGSDRFKSLKRLFPSDQSMVVIIDDRADVWEWSPNLVRVNAYEFFVGTGDINAAFLPKQSNELPDTTSPDLPSAESSAGPSTPPGDLPEIQIQGVEETEARIKQAEEVERELEERPLAKAQESLDSQAQISTDAVVTTPEGDKGSPPALDPLEHRIVKAILNNDDQELDRINDILCEVHRSFYEMHDARTIKRTKPMPDVSTLVSQRKARTFAGLHLVFSGLYPIQPHPERTDIWRLAASFGATCHADINTRVTHLVAAKPGTAKIERAFSLGNIFVVNDRWLKDSQAQWQRQPEGRYLMKSGHRKTLSLASQSEKPANGGSSKVVGENGTESKSTDNAPGVHLAIGSEEQSDTLTQVSSVEEYAKNGTDSRVSFNESVAISDNDSNGPFSDTAEIATLPESEEVVDDGDIQLHIDWAEVDKEVDDALASDDDDTNDESNSEETMPGVIQTTRGIKRQRGDETSAPSTPSRLRFSTVATYPDESEGPSPKRPKLGTGDSTSHDSARDSSRPRSPLVPNAAEGGVKTLPDLSPEIDDELRTPTTTTGQEENQVDGDDDDDFLAREMAAGGDTDDWDDSSDDED